MPIPPKVLNDAPKTARERVYVQLKQWIIDGTLQPEERISDMELAKYFSVSRTPVREAMQQLADQRLINIFPGKESRVAPIDFEQARQTYQIIAQLYSLAMEFAYPYITEENIAELKDINRKFAEALHQGNSAAGHDYDRQFHSVFLRIADNDFLTNFIGTLDCHVARIEILYYNTPDSLHTDSIQQHDAIIDALSQKNLPLAVEKVMHNWLQTLENLLPENG